MNTFIKLVLNEVSKAQTLLLGLKGLMRLAFTFSYDDVCVSINSNTFQEGTRGEGVKNPEVGKTPFLGQLSHDYQKNSWGQCSQVPGFQNTLTLVLKKIVQDSKNPLTTIYIYFMD